MRLVLRLALAPVAALGLYMAAAVLGGLWLSPGAPPGGAVPVGLVRGPIHTDFLLPATPETRAAFAFAAADVPVDQASWIVAGWGSRDFYTTIGTYGDVEPGAIVRAATGDAAVLRVDASGPWPHDLMVPVLKLSEAQYAALVAGIAGDAAGPALAHPGHTATDAFFPANGRVHAFQTCNNWISKRLRAAGVAFGRWTPTAGSVALSRWRVDRRGTDA